MKLLPTRGRLVLTTAIFMLAVYSAMSAAASSDSQSAASKPNYASLFSQLEQTETVVEGSAHPRSILYVFFDANCFYCRLSWQALQHYERVGLQVRWVPVAYQQESSTGRAAAILTAKNRVAALHRNEIKYDATHYDGGIAPMKNVSVELAKKLQANTELMNKFGAPGTPAFVWKDSQGKVAFKAGMLRLSEIPRITGLPEQHIKDRELADFR